MSLNHNNLIGILETEGFPDCHLYLSHHLIPHQNTDAHSCTRMCKTGKTSACDNERAFKYASFYWSLTCIFSIDWLIKTWFQTIPYTFLGIMQRHCNPMYFCQNAVSGGMESVKYFPDFVVKWFDGLHLSDCCNYGIKKSAAIADWSAVSKSVNDQQMALLHRRWWQHWD